MIDLKAVGQRIEGARQSLKIERDETAEYLRIPISEYIKIEQGSYQVNGDQIILLSKLFRRNFRYFLTDEYKSAESQVCELFRQNEEISKNDRISIAEFMQLCENKDIIEKLLGRNKAELPRYLAGDFRTTNYTLQGKLAADKERERLGVVGPITNLYALFRRHKLHIFRRRMEDRTISGVYIKHPIVGDCVLINYNDDIYRQNFSVVHEYCHALFDSNVEQSISFIKGQEKNPIEWRANGFAGNFLVPDIILKELSNLRFKDEEHAVENILRICNYFKVSSKVVIYRLKDIGILKDGEEKKLLISKRLVIPKNVKLDPELEDLSEKSANRISNIIQSGISVEYIQLCRSAFSEGLITRDKMLQSLFRPIDKAKEIMDYCSTLMEV